MNLSKTSLSILLIVAIFFAGYFTKGCSGSDESNVVDTVTTVEIRHDTITNTITEKVRSKPDTVFVRKTDTLRDTAYVYADYYNYKWYPYEYRDSNVSIYLKAGIWQNSLDSISLDYDLYNETKTVTKEITKTKTYDYRILGGGSIEFNRLNLNASVDFGSFQIGVYRNLLSRNELQEIDKWGVRGEFVLFEN